MAPLTTSKRKVRNRKLGEWREGNKTREQQQNVEEKKRVIRVDRGRKMLVSSRPYIYPDNPKPGISLEGGKLMLTQGKYLDSSKTDSFFKELFADNIGSL